MNPRQIFKVKIFNPRNLIETLQTVVVLQHHSEELLTYQLVLLTRVKHYIPVRKDILWKDQRYGIVKQMVNGQVLNQNASSMVCLSVWLVFKEMDTLQRDIIISCKYLSPFS